MLRLFVGIALSPELKLALSRLAIGLPGARWVDPGNYHLTLRFIGEVDEGMASDIDAALTRVRAKRFALTLAGIDSFNARSLFVGVERNPDLVHLQEKAESALARSGIEPEGRRFAPHVTLARLKGKPDAKLGQFLAAHALFRAAPFDVAQFQLVASYLTKSGAIYEDQAEYALEE
ncbi:MAG: RNA 2',3'-cyclic phosphodiesterase [Alphaproteobacteria bacterium]|nr:RNA 2',3'-cyclic phosphodiesterase [Alphaproteobacteria bacterium]